VPGNAPNDGGKNALPVIKKVIVPDTIKPTIKPEIIKSTIKPASLNPLLNRHYQTRYQNCIY
jgi:hypothetical protein